MAPPPADPQGAEATGPPLELYAVEARERFPGPLILGPLSRTGECAGGEPRRPIRGPPPPVHKAVHQEVVLKQPYHSMPHTRQQTTTNIDADHRHRGSVIKKKRYKCIKIGALIWRKTHLRLI
jgi:hypothetical protein